MPLTSQTVTNAEGILQPNVWSTGHVTLTAVAWTVAVVLTTRRTNGKQLTSTRKKFVKLVGYTEISYTDVELDSKTASK